MSNTKNKSKMLFSLLCVVTANITDCAETAAGGSPAATAGDNDNPPAAGKRRITCTTLGGTVTELDVYPDITLAQLKSMIPGTMSDYDLVYDTKPLTNDRQLREPLQKDNPQITLLHSPFRVWQRELSHCLSRVLEYAVSQNNSAMAVSITEILSQFKPLFENKINLNDAKLVRYKNLDTMSLEWELPVEQDLISLSIENPRIHDIPVTTVTYSLEREDISVPHEGRARGHELEFYMGATATFVCPTNVTALNVNKTSLPPVPQIPTYIFLQPEDAYQAVTHDAIYNYS